jgi:uncharacterized protein (TIGR03067 family)
MSCNAKQSTAPLAPTTELEGTWSGKNANLDTAWVYRMTRDSIIIMTDSVVTCRGIFSVDTSASPKSIDINIGWSSHAQDIGAAFKGIYRLSANILDISANAPGTARPASFDIVPYVSLHQ